MCKAVLLAVNARYVHSSLAVWYLAAGVSRYARFPHEVTVLETSVHQPDADIVGKIAAYAPDVVGIGVYIWNAGKLPGLLNQLRISLPKATLVLGGPEASYNASYWLCRGVDCVVRGEGERSFAAFLDALADGGCASIPSVYEEAKPLTELVDPYCDAYFDALGDKIAYLETTRGCPFQCAFCLSGGSGVRFFPLDKAKAQLSKLSAAGTRTIKLVDRTFNCDAKRAYDLFAFVIGLDTTCRFHFEVAADLFDDKTLALLSGAPPGRIQLEAGLQSFHEPALKATSRHTDLAKAQRNIRALVRPQNIHVHVDLIAGLPYETLSDFQSSFDCAYALGAHTLQLGFLKLLHGSPLRAQAESLEIEYSQEPPYEILRSPWLSAEDMRTLKQTESALQHTTNKGRFLSALQYLLSVSGLRPFSLYQALGAALPNHGTPPEAYAELIYHTFSSWPQVDADILRDHLVCDWLRSFKGKNMPPVLTRRRRKSLTQTASGLLGRSIDRDEAAVLSTGQVVFIDSADRDPVTGLYRLFLV